MPRNRGDSARKKATVSRIIDWLFYALYIMLIAVTILDMCGVPIPLVDEFTENNDTLLRFMLIVFASVGIVVLNDKRELAKNIANPLKYVEQLIIAGKSDSSNLVYFDSKDSLYIYFTQEIKHLENGAEVLVTAFDKNQGLHYYTGENKHIEAFMDDWSTKIKSNSINVKQIVHVFTKKEAIEMKERVEQYKDCYNYALGAILGMPIRPYIDFAVINKNTVLLSFPNDKTAPYDTAFGLAIRSTEIANEFERYFNIYWNEDCSIIKNRDGVNEDNLNRIELLALSTSNFSDFKRYNTLLMELIANSAPYRNLNKFIDDLHLLSSVEAYSLPHKLAADKLEKAYDEIHNKIMSSAINIKVSDVQSIMSMSIVSARQKIQATSIEIGDDSYWTTKDGESIFSLNIRSIADRGIAISRIFIMNPVQMDSLSETLQRQRAAGVKVLTIKTEMSTRGAFKDFIIIDNKVVIEILANGNAKMYIGKDKIQEYVQIFDTYMRQAS